MRWRFKSLDNLRTGTDATVLLLKKLSPISYAAKAKLRACFGSRFASLFLQTLARDANSLLLVGIWRSQRTNVGGNLANLSLIRTADDEVRLLVHGDLNTFRNRKLDGMRLAESKIDYFAFKLRAIADADDVHLFLEALRNTLNGIGHERASQAVNRAMLFSQAFHVQDAVLLFEGNTSWNKNAHFALRALDFDFVRGDGDFYAGRQWNWFV